MPVCYRTNGESMTEAEEYKLWVKQNGVDPKTGKAWLTKRMEKEAKLLQNLWDQQEECNKTGILKIWKKK
jgi:hypothetical protein